MKCISLIKFTLQQIFGRWTWALLIVLVIALSSTSFIILGSMSDELSQTQATITRYNVGFALMYGGSPMYLIKDIFTLAPNSYPFSEESVVKVLSIEGVQSVYRVTTVTIPYQVEGGDTLSLGLIGVETGAVRDALLPYANMVSGRFLDAEDLNGAVINFGLTGKIRPGTENLTLSTLGRNTTLRVLGVYDSFLPREMDPQESVLVDQSTFWSMVNASKHRYSALLVSVKNPADGAGVTSKLMNEFPGASVIYQYKLAEHTVGLLSSTSILYGVISALVVIVAAATVVLLRVLDLVKRRRELGLLMVIGWREESIVGYLFNQSLILGLSGAAVGMGISYTLGLYLIGILTPYELTASEARVSLVLNPSYFLYASLLAIFFSVFAFVITYLFYRRLTPLKMLEDI